MAEQVLVEVSGALGRIRLNRPEALNSLTPEMIRLIDQGLDRLVADPAVKVIALTGEGGKGLCAGGDIKTLWQLGQDDPEAAMAFWAEEYRLDARLHRLEKPVVAVMDGICMGGGVGLSVHGSHPVVTERTRFAMPETGIGYFPDVGGSYMLPRLADEMGIYLGLTGEAVSGADVLAMGLAKGMVSSTGIEAFLADLAAGKAAEAALERHGIKPGPSAVEATRAQIARLFAGEDIGAIFQRLEAEGSAFATKTLARLRQQCPGSLVLTLALMRRGARLADLESCLAQELAADRMILTLPDFYEGIRAQVIDKDRQPKWQPPRLEEVDQAALLARLEAALAAG